MSEIARNMDGRDLQRLAERLRQDSDVPRTVTKSIRDLASELGDDSIQLPADLRRELRRSEEGGEEVNYRRLQQRLNDLADSGND